MALFDRFGLKDNPYSVNPITYDTLELFVGRKNERDAGNVRWWQKRKRRKQHRN